MTEAEAWCECMNALEGYMMRVSGKTCNVFLYRNEFYGIIAHHFYGQIMINQVQLSKDTDSDDEGSITDAGIAGVAPTGLTEWKNPPTIRDLKQDLSDARNVHFSQENKISTWLDNLNVTGKAKIKVAVGNSAIVPKLIRKQAEWRYAALSEPYLSTDDVFKVEPISWEDRKAAQQNQILLNNQFNTKINKVSFIDTYIRTLVDEGTAIVRVTWDFIEEEYQAVVPLVQYVIDLDFMPTIEYIEKLKQDSPSQYATDVPDELKQAHAMSMEQEQPIRPEIIGQQTVTKMRTIKNCPNLEVCDYRNVVVDPTCLGDIEKAGFVIYSLESSLSQLKKDGKYNNLEQIQVANNGPLNEPDHRGDLAAMSFNFSDEPRKKIVVHEYWGFWDIHGTGKTVAIVAAWVGSTLIRLEENPYPDKQLPFVVVQYLPVRRSTHGEPDGVLIEDNQKIAGAVTRGMIDIMARSANGQTGMRKDMLDAINKRKWEQGKDYEFNGNVDPRMGVHMHTFNEIPQSAPMLLQMQNMEAESLTGVKSFSQGVSGNALGEVAAGVRGALDAASKRELGILRRCSAGLVAIGRKIIAMNAVFLEPEEVIRITNEEFVMVRKDDLPGNFDLKLGVSTAEEDEKKAQELAMMLQTMGPNMNSDMTRMILSDIARLRKMPELAKKIEMFEPKPDPVQEQMMKLQMALLQAQIVTEQAKAASLGATANLSSTKVGTEVAKAAHYASDTDQRNLDFVEQESGVKQERELQKVQQTAEHQAKNDLLNHYMEAKAAKKSTASK